MLFAAIPAYGHLFPMLPLALACAGAGHDVTIAAGPPFVGRLPLRTVAQQPVEVGLDWAFGEAQRRHPEAVGLELTIAMFAHTAPEAVLSVLLPTLEQERPDVVVYEAMDVGAGIAADLLGIPAVAFGIGLTGVGPTMVHAAARGFHQARWRDRGLTPPSPEQLIARAYIDPVPASLHRFGPPRPDPSLPIRPVAYSPTDGVRPAALDDAGRPWVYLTLGTVSFGAVEVLQRTLADLAGLDVEVLVAVGPDGDPAALGPVGDHVHLERFVDQAAVLERVSVMVHHGGTGSVLGALAAGVPQLILPQGADQFMNAEIVPQVGAALALRNDEQSPGAIRAAVEALLTDDQHRAAAARLAAEIATLPPPESVVLDLEALASAG